MWRPSRRTSLEVHAGRRYGSMSYTAAFSYQPSPRTSFQMAVYDGISSFGRQLNDNLADLSTSFIATRNPFSGDLTGCAFGAQSGGVCRSEEHTSELQSLMRISYAVFCLKQKTTDT